jgi:o-succinylbenzoate synthase
MNIRAAQVRLVSGRLPTWIRNAQREWTQREGALLQLRDEAGHVGWGEASPLPGYSPDTLGDCATSLERWARGTLPAVDLSRPWRGQVTQAVERLSAQLPAARFALETALLDLVGQAAGKPVPALLGAKNGASIPVCALLTAEEPEAQHAELERLLNAGYRSFKRKLIGPTSDEELALLGELRAAAGEGIRFRFDANQSLPASAVAGVIRALAELDAEWLEEPSRVWPDESALPLAADETLQNATRASEILSSFAARRPGPLGLSGAVVLKPMMLGGVLPCLALARRALEAGATAVASHSFDGPVALTAAAALALALPGNAAASARMGSPAWGNARLPFGDGPEIAPWPAPGLGVEGLT